MKIRVEFTQKEKEVIANAVGSSLKDDNKERLEGDFGTVFYDPKGYLELNLNTGVIEDLSGIIGNLVGLVKSFIGKWFNDVNYTKFIKR